MVLIIYQTLIEIKQNFDYWWNFKSWSLITYTFFSNIGKKGLIYIYIFVTPPREHFSFSGALKENMNNDGESDASWKCRHWKWKIMFTFSRCSKQDWVIIFMTFAKCLVSALFIIGLIRNSGRNMILHQQKIKMNIWTYLSQINSYLLFV